MAEMPESALNALVNRLARTMDPEAWGELPDDAVLGVRWEQIQRQWATIEYARRVIAAGWAPREQTRPGVSRAKGELKECR